MNSCNQKNPQSTDARSPEEHANQILNAIGATRLDGSSSDSGISETIEGESSGAAWGRCPQTYAQKHTHMHTHVPKRPQALTGGSPMAAGW